MRVDSKLLSKRHERPSRRPSPNWETDIPELLAHVALPHLVRMARRAVRVAFSGTIRTFRPLRRDAPTTVLFMPALSEERRAGRAGVVAGAARSRWVDAGLPAAPRRGNSGGAARLTRGGPALGSGRRALGRASFTATSSRRCGSRGCPGAAG